METANQYGIDLGNILSTVSTIKSAKATNALNEYKIQKMAQEEDQLLKEKQAEEEYLKNPKSAKPASVEQATKWGGLEKTNLENQTATIQRDASNTVVALTNISHIQDPAQQQAELIKYVQSLPPEVQQQAILKYGDKDGNITTQSIPYAINDAITTFKGAKGIAEEDLAKIKAQTALENLKEMEKIRQVDREKLKKIPQAKSPGSEKTKTPKPTDKDKLVKALMTKYPGMSEAEARIFIYKNKLNKTSTGPMGDINTSSEKSLPSGGTAGDPLGLGIKRK